MSSQIHVKEILNKARRILKHPGLDLLVAPVQQEPSKLIVITSRHIGNAVERNTIRRRIKALFHEEKLDEKQYDWVIIVKKSGIDLSYDQLQKIIVDAIHTARL